jgi:hypothetical protein
VPDSVARFGRFGIGLGDHVSSSLGSQLRVVSAPMKATGLKDACFFGCLEKIMRP